MKEQRTGSSSGKARRVTGHGAKGDAQTEQLKKITKKLGNAQVQSVIGKNDRARDAIYQFIVHRLQKIQQVQGQEKEAMKKQRVWFDEVAHKKAGFGLPDPTRWREAAKKYRAAAESVARGNLGQAAQHLESAMEAERKAFRDLPKEIPLDHHLTEEGQSGDRPEAMAQVHAGEGCTPREVSEALRVADEIERVTEKSKGEGIHKPRLHWWDVAEGEDDGEEGKKTGAKGGKRAADATGEQAEAKTEPEKRGEDQEREKAEEEEQDVEVEQARAKEVAVDLGGRPASLDVPAPVVKTVRTRVKKG